MNMSMGQIQTSAGGMPVVILREGTRENKGREAQKNNLTAAKLVAEVVKSSLGPRGMDKMLVDSKRNRCPTSCSKNGRRSSQISR